MTNKNLNNILTLDKFSSLTEDELMMVEGGFVILGITIAGALAVKVALAGAATGAAAVALYYNNK